MMGYNSIFESLQELFPQIDVRILKTIAMEHPTDADEAASVVITEVVPLLLSNQPEDEILESPPVCKVEPVDEGMSLTQWLNPSKVPESYLALLNEEAAPDEKPDLGYVMEKIVLPSNDDAVGGIRNVHSGSEKGGIGSKKRGCSMVKPSIRVQSCTKNEVSGSSSKVPVSRRNVRKSEHPWSQNYSEKLRSWKKKSNNNNRDFSQHYGEYRDASSTKFNRNNKKFCADERRKQRIDNNIKALAKLLPHEFEDDSSELILNETISHVKLLELQMKLSRSRLGGELVSHPMTFIEGYGHYIHHEETKPLEEVMGELLVSDPNGAVNLLESKGLHLMPLSSVQGLC